MRKAKSPGKSMRFHKKETEKIELVTRPGFSQPRYGSLKRHATFNEFKINFFTEQERCSIVGLAPRRTRGGLDVRTFHRAWTFQCHQKLKCLGKTHRLDSRLLCPLHWSASLHRQAYFYHCPSMPRGKKMYFKGSNFVPVNFCQSKWPSAGKSS